MISIVAIVIQIDYSRSGFGLHVMIACQAKL